MKQQQTLDHLELGKKAKVEKIKNTGTIRRRLLDMGMIPGTTIESILKSPAGELTAYLIRGALIAIRSEDASKIIIERV